MTLNATRLHNNEKTKIIRIDSSNYMPSENKQEREQENEMSKGRENISIQQHSGGKAEKKDKQKTHEAIEINLIISNNY